MKTGRQREVQSGRQEGIARETERERKNERKGETDRGVREGDRLRDRERRRGSEIGGWNQRTTEDETGRQTGGETRETESEREISGERQGEGRGGYLCYCTFRWSAFPSTFVTPYLRPRRGPIVTRVSQPAALVVLITPTSPPPRPQVVTRPIPSDGRRLCERVDPPTCTPPPS